MSSSKKDALASYYKEQLGLSEEELKEMLLSFETPLPAGCRLNVAADGTELVLKALLDCKEAHPLHFYPQPNTAFHFEELSRLEIKRDSEFKLIKQMLVDASEVGALSRQEAVSMVPPCVLTLPLEGRQPPVLRILDLCAAPGSKTSQLADMTLSLVAASSPPLYGCPIPENVAIIANDVNPSRAGLLNHQIDRLGAPHVAITCCDASQFPIRLLATHVLCDVPCSGDGTLRKNVDIWKSWKVENGIGLHGLQKKILLRALRLVKPGGRVTYSTCSLNPIEDESVIYHALAESEAKIEIEKWNDLRGLKRREGLTFWKSPNERMAAPLEEFQLKNCSRFLPHVNNTGGFFVANLLRLLNKKEEDKENNGERVRPSKKSKPSICLPNLNEDSDLKEALLFYGLIEEEEDSSQSAAKLSVENSKAISSLSEIRVLHQPLRTFSEMDVLPVIYKADASSSSSLKKRVYLATPELIKTIQSYETSSLQFVRIGSRIFEKSTLHFYVQNSGSYRLVQNGLRFLIPHMKRRIIFFEFKEGLDFKAVLDSGLELKQLLDLEEKRIIRNLSSCRNKDGLLEAGGVAVCFSTDFIAAGQLSTRGFFELLIHSDLKERWKSLYSHGISGTSS